MKALSDFHCWHRSSSTPAYRSAVTSPLAIAATASTADSSASSAAPIGGGIGRAGRQPAAPATTAAPAATKSRRVSSFGRFMDASEGTSRALRSTGDILASPATPGEPSPPTQDLRMIPTIRHLHHVTATVADAQPDLDFYTGLLGLRLVKKTVNFDNHFVYHFYYGDERGTPGTIMTTFPYKGHGVRAGTKGAGQVTVTSLSVPTGALDFWRTRLAARGVAVTDLAPRFGDPVIRFA